MSKQPLTPVLNTPHFLIISLLFTLFWGTLFSQSSKPFFIPDSLKNHSFEELYNKQFIFEDTPNEKIYIETYLHKAKNENDSIRIAHGYSQHVPKYDMNELYLKYSDSILMLTKDWNHKIYPGYAYMIKGIFYYNVGDYKKALKYHLKARKIAIKNNNIQQLHYSCVAISGIKINWGNYREVKSILLPHLKMLTKLNDSLKLEKSFLFENKYLQVIELLVDVYSLENQPDSAYYFAKTGINLSLKNQDLIKYHNFVFKSGEIAYYNEEYDRALDSLNKAYPYRKFHSNKIFYHYYVGSIFNKWKKEIVAFRHFKKADSIFNITNDVVPEIKNIQQYLVNYYREIGDTKNQLKYIDRLIHIDSIIDDNRIYLNETIKNEYDIPELLAEKEEILQTLNKEKTQLNFINTGLMGVVLLILSYAVYSYRKNRMYKLKLKQFLQKREQELKAVAKKKKTPLKNTSTISDEIVIDILQKLDRFEKMNYYLNNKITLASLAKRWKTNSSYLSKIINEHKQKSFTNYLSDLRIDYSIEKIITDKKFRKFKIEAIGLEVGFNNGQSFAKQFHLKTGVYPSFFIKEIESLNKHKKDHAS